MRVRGEETDAGVGIAGGGKRLVQTLGRERQPRSRRCLGDIAKAEEALAGGGMSHHQEITKREWRGFELYLFDLYSGIIRV